MLFKDISLDYSGYLYKWSNKKNKFNKYYFELRETFLLYFENENNNKLPKGIICLDGLIVREKD